MLIEKQVEPGVRWRVFQTNIGLPVWGRRWLLLGMWWFLVGLAASPVGEAVWNPGKPYHTSLLLLFVPPALWLAWKRRREFAWRFTHTAEGLLTLIFLGWAMLSVSWANYGHLGDAAIVVVYVVLFVTIWAAQLAENSRRFQRLLLWGGIGLAVSALLAMIIFHWRTLHTASWQEEGRLVAFGTLDNPNLAGFVFGAAMVWLVQISVRDRALRIAQVIAIAMLAVFVVMTFSRATWLAILVCQGCMLFGARHGHIRWRATVVLAAAAVAIGLGGWQYMAQRGLSYRPQIMEQAWKLIEAHPWRGLGMGSRYTIQVGDQVWQHSHNIFSHTAIMLGLPAMLLWLAIWLIVGWRGWQFRHLAMGRCLLALWIYASVAWQFDAPELMQKPDVEWLLGWLPLSISMGLAWRMSDMADRPSAAESHEEE